MNLLVKKYYPLIGRLICPIKIFDAPALNCSAFGYESDHLPSAFDWPAGGMTGTLDGGGASELIKKYITRIITPKYYKNINYQTIKKYKK